MASLDGRVCLVTGAGRGLGREHAMFLASEGARGVVNDLGGGVDGSGADEGPAHAVVAEIEAAGGTAIANGESVTPIALSPVASSTSAETRSVSTPDGTSMTNES